MPPLSLDIYLSSEPKDERKLYNTITTTIKWAKNAYRKLVSGRIKVYHGKPHGRRATTSVLPFHLVASRMNKGYRNVEKVVPRETKWQQTEAERKRRQQERRPYQEHQPCCHQPCGSHASFSPRPRSAIYQQGYHSQPTHHCSHHHHHMHDHQHPQYRMQDHQHHIQDRPPADSLCAGCNQQHYAVNRRSSSRRQSWTEIRRIRRERRQNSARRSSRSPQRSEKRNSSDKKSDRNCSKHGKSPCRCKQRNRSRQYDGSSSSSDSSSSSSSEN